MQNEKEIKIAMIAAASAALDYLKSNPKSDSERIMKFVIKHLNAEHDSKIAGIAAANHVLKLKERNFKLTDKKAMQDLTDNAENILRSIKTQEKSEL